MSAAVEAIIAGVKARGLSLELGNSGPKVKGPKENLTPALVAALKAFRREVVAHLEASMPRVKVFLWRDGHLYRQPPEEDGQFPAGAWWWRWSNETAWQVVPGREEWAAGHSPPEVAGA